MMKDKRPFEEVHPNQLAFPAKDPYSCSLTKREYFAVSIMQGLAANASITWLKDGNALASLAVQQADRLIAELNL